MTVAIVPEPVVPQPAMTEEHLLSVDGVTVSFDGFKAVDDLSLYVDRNELRAVIGPNGAGKTTVLDLISGRTKPSAGSIKFKGRELRGMSEHQIVRAGVGRKFQTPSVYETLTVFENLEMSYPKGRTAFGAWAFTRTKAVTDKVREIAVMVHLEPRLDDPAELLSHGQKQWLEIGMLLIQDPQLLMLDEPVAGMAVDERERTADLLRKICKGRAVLVVEHDMEFVQSIADRVTVLHQGKWLAEGRMETVQKDPKVIEVYLGH
jgi:urea transport system ATP-binding protein